MLKVFNGSPFQTSVNMFLNNVYYEAVMVRGVVRWHVCVPSAAVAWVAGRISSLSSNGEPGLGNADLLFVHTATHSHSL